MMQLRTPDYSPVGPAGAVPIKLSACLMEVFPKELERLYSMVESAQNKMTSS